MQHNDLTRYKQQRNRVLNMIRESRQAFFSNLDTASAKEFWKAVKMLGRKNATLPSISNGTTQADTGQGKACLLNNFFYSCFNRACSPLELAPNSVDPNFQLSIDPSNFPENLKCSSDLSPTCLLHLTAQSLQVLMIYHH